ncbi:MAG: hypothetical protein ACP5RV_07395 [Thiomonas sp.]
MSRAFRHRLEPHPVRRCLVGLIGLCLAVALGGCASLLPRGAAQTSKPWSDFNQAHAAYERIQPYQAAEILHADASLLRPGC